ncbi:MAG: PIG-L deacetylase family protein [Candidatus Saccharimonas sp.]
MKKVIFGIFAHPDDEAFGPCGTLVKAVREGAELHLVSLTLGEAGQNPDNVMNLGEVREAEWRAAGKLIGATSLHTLHRPDGHLDNIAMQEVSHELIAHTQNVLSVIDEPYQVEFITLDSNGLTGHIDHIVAARSASFVYQTLKRRGLPLTRIRYYCSSDEQTPELNIDWIYADKGHTTDEIGDTVDARDYRDDIIAIMRTHYSQRQDSDYCLTKHGENLGLDHFLVTE